MANLTSEACRAARALLGWTAKELGERAGITLETIIKFENGRPMRESNKAKLADVFEAAGVEIMNGNAPGARLRFQEAWAHQRDNGEWVVATRWKDGDPVELVAPASARKAAEEARARGDERVAAALEAAAANAERRA